MTFNFKSLIITVVISLASIRGFPKFKRKAYFFCPNFPIMVSKLLQL
nr:MAG TPA: hypothetical protein [Caudoviricetes sp.]